MEAIIRPVTFSDHHLVAAHLVIPSGPNCSANWKFNVKLLQNATFCSSFQEFWSRWRQRESLSQWWDIGNAQIRVFCQQYTSLSSAESRRALEALEHSIRQVELELVGSDSGEHQENLVELRSDLGVLLQDRAKGCACES